MTALEKKELMAAKGGQNERDEAGESKSADTDI